MRKYVLGSYNIVKWPYDFFLWPLYLVGSIAWEAGSDKEMLVLEGLIVLSTSS